MQKAVVFNKYLKGLGGGERSTFAYARALKELGFEVEVVSTNTLPDVEGISQSFGAEFGEIPMRYSAMNEFLAGLRESPPDVFVNHSFKDFTPNYGKIGIYSQMFPTVRISRRSQPKEVEALQSYDLLFNNSSFTKRYTDILWDYPPEQSHVLHPPIGDDMIARARALRTASVKKEKLLIGIGRFNVFPTNKNQKLLIECFLEARERCPALGDWKLLLVGNCNPDEESNSYLNECIELAGHSAGAVEIATGLPHGALGESLQRSFGYVHACGAFYPPGEEPHRCEHLGLSIVEGMAHGCIPLVYARGGIFDILDVATAGIAFATREGLVDGFLQFPVQWEESEHGRVQMSLGEMALQLEFAAFKEKLGGYLKNFAL